MVAFCDQKIKSFSAPTSQTPRNHTPSALPRPPDPHQQPPTTPASNATHQDAPQSEVTQRYHGGVDRPSRTARHTSYGRDEHGLVNGAVSRKGRRLQARMDDSERDEPVSL